MKFEYEALSRSPPNHAAKKNFVENCMVTVPQTDTGRWDEYSKVIERTTAKELGKMTP